MSVSFGKLFQPTLLSSDGANLYTADTTATGVLRNILLHVANVSSATRTVTVHAIPSGGSPASTNKIANAMSVPVNDYILITVPYLEDGDRIYAEADQDSALTAHFVSGDTFTS